MLINVESIDAKSIDHGDDVTTLVDIDDGQFPAFFRLLEKAAGLAIPSLLGWRVGSIVRGEPVNVTFARYPLTTVDVRASLHIPLVDVLIDSPDGYVTLFASQSHAFKDFAADIARALHLPESRFALDQHLESLTLTSPDDRSGAGADGRMSNF